MRQTTWTHVYFIAQLFYFIALVRTALGQDRSETKKIRSWSWSTVTKFNNSRRISGLTSCQPRALGQDWQLLLATAALRWNYFFQNSKIFFQKLKSRIFSQKLKNIFVNWVAPVRIQHTYREKFSILAFSMLHVSFFTIRSVATLFCIMFLM